MVVSLFFVGMFAGVVAVLYRLLRVGRRPHDYPPGPPTLPILGNMHQVRSIVKSCIYTPQHDKT